LLNETTGFFDELITTAPQRDYIDVLVIKGR